MKLGTISYEEKIYNLDYMSSEEIESLLNKIINKRKQNITLGKKLLNEEK
ncbi:MAG: hypothetical protein ACI4UE_00670 [Candidatus Scatovivens sp.]